METGTIIKSENFHTPPYWVVKCDNVNLPGNRKGELPIDQLSMKFKHCMEKVSVKFELVEIGKVENYKWYAKLK